MQFGAAMHRPMCRFCGEVLQHTLVDLGMSPLCESYLKANQLNQMEPFYPLHVYVCAHCFLVQLEEYVNPDHIFTEYAYFSSYSDTWLAHAKSYTELMIDRFQLDSTSHIMEIGSNDGYLLQHFVKRGISVLGIEPAANIAQTALEKGVPTSVQFFGEQVARDMVGAGRQADLLVGNNVLAQVPALNDFVRGMRILLKPHGVITMEFPHLMQLMEGNQFDTIYHEHFSYFSFLTVEKIFAAHGLAIFDVEELPTHGGSLRIYIHHREDTVHTHTSRILDLRVREEASGFTQLVRYFAFAEKVKDTKRKLLTFLIEAKRQGKFIAAYGAPGKGNTLLNYCGIRTDFIDYTVDRNPYKQGKFLPGTHIPIFHPDKIKESQPDYLLILPWNFKDEIMTQMSYVSEWGCRFVVPIPEVKIYGA
jgi:2-polyprenyl-3-methyl-5-hydroxy-6-metoxy-1,4-benzoquinol methylase